MAQVQEALVVGRWAAGGQRFASSHGHDGAETPTTARTSKADDAVQAADTQLSAPADAPGLRLRVVSWPSRWDVLLQSSSLASGSGVLRPTTRGNEPGNG